MSTSSLVAAVVAAALGFWIVGAYKRLTRLRGDVVRLFAPFDTQLTSRQSLLHRQIDALTTVLVSAGPRLEALRAACHQTEAARAHAKARPARRDRIAGLRVAEDTLAEARGRLPVPGAPGPELAAVQAQLTEVDATLRFAREQFNLAASRYNEAASQFPTLLVAALFGMGPAGTL